MLEYFLLYLAHRFKHSLDEMSKAFISLTSPGTKNYFKLFKYLNSRAKILIKISNNTTEFYRRCTLEESFSLLIIYSMAMETLRKIFLNRYENALVLFEYLTLLFCFVGSVTKVYRLLVNLVFLQFLREGRWLICQCIGPTVWV